MQAWGELWDTVEPGRPMAVQRRDWTAAKWRAVGLALAAILAMANGLVEAADGGDRALDWMLGPDCSGPWLLVRLMV